MRGLALIAMTLLLSGCESLAYDDSDSYSPGSAGYEQFVTDSTNCAYSAGQFVSYDMHGMGGTSYRHRRLYNRIYGDCMIKHGYAPRSPVQNIVPQKPEL